MMGQNKESNVGNVRFKKRIMREEKTRMLVENGGVGWIAMPGGNTRELDRGKYLCERKNKHKEYTTRWERKEWKEMNNCHSVAADPIPSMGKATDPIPGIGKAADPIPNIGKATDPIPSIGKATDCLLLQQQSFQSPTTHFISFHLLFLWLLQITLKETTNFCLQSIDDPPPQPSKNLTKQRNKSTLQCSCFPLG